MSKLTYKLLVNPFNPRKVFLREITVHELGEGIDKRDIHESELKNWTEEEFLTKLTESGYRRAAENYIATHPYLFKKEEKEK